MSKHVDAAATTFADRAALETAEGHVTYRKLAELVEGAVEQLTEFGLRRGNRASLPPANP